MIVRIKGIKKTRGRNGAVYFYDRVSGRRISAAPDTPEFVAEISALRAAVLAIPAEDAKIPGTWGWLVTYWRSSPEWNQLAPRTRADYLRVLDYLAPLDGMPLTKMVPASIMEIRNKAFARHKRRFANYVLAAISRAWTVGSASGKVPHGNPVTKEQKVRRPKGAPTINRPWSPPEIRAAYEAMPDHLRVAMALALFAGWREGDVCRLKRHCYDGATISGRQGKTDGLVQIPAHSALKAVLDAEIARLPRLPDAPLVINRRGRGFTESGFRASFFKIIRELTATGAVSPGLTFHGLRVTLATWIADAGGDTRDIAATLGHTTEAMAIHYARHADRSRRAARAIALLEQQTNEILENKPD